MRRSLKKVHQLIGVFIALYMLVMAGTGGLLTFKDPILARLIPEIAGEVTSLDAKAQAAALRAIEDRYAVPGVRSVKLPREGVNAYKVYLKDRTEILLNAETLDPVQDRLHAFGLFVVLFDIHHRLAAGEVGENIVGLLGLVAIFSLFSGVYLWWPWRRGFQFRNVIPVNRRASSYRLSHVTLGAMIAPLLIVSTLTGTAMIYSSAVRVALATLFGGDKPTITAVLDPDHDPRETLFTAKALVFPTGEPTIYIPPRGSSASYSIRLQMPKEWHPNGRSTVVADITSGKLSFYNAPEAALGHNIADAVYPVHAGKTGSLAWQLIVATSGLGGFFLAYAGLNAYIRRRRKRTAAASRK